MAKRISNWQEQSDSDLPNYDEKALKELLEKLNKNNLSLSIDPMLVEKAKAKAEKLGILLDEAVQEMLHRWLFGQINLENVKERKLKR